MGFYKWHCPKGNNVNSPTFQRGDSVDRSQVTDPGGAAQTADLRSYFRARLLHPLQEGILWSEEEAVGHPAVTRLKSGVNMMIIIHIAALKRGDSEEPMPLKYTQSSRVSDPPVLRVRSRYVF